MMISSVLIIILFLSKNTHGGVVRREATEACGTDGVVSDVSCMCGIETCEVGGSCELASSSLVPFELTTIFASNYYNPSPSQTASNYGSDLNPYIYKNTPAICTPECATDGEVFGASCMCGDTICKVGGNCDLTTTTCIGPCGCVACSGLWPVTADGWLGGACMCGETICEVGSTCDLTSKVCITECEPDGVVAGTSCICGDAACETGQICDFTSTSCYKCYASSTGILLENSGLECANGDFVDTWNGCRAKGSFRVRCPENYFPCNNLANNGEEFRCMKDCTDDGGLKECYKEACPADGVVSGGTCMCGDETCQVGGSCDLKSTNCTPVCALDGVVTDASCMCGDETCKVGSSCDLTSTTCTPLTPACYDGSTGIYLINSGLECANGKFVNTWNGCIAHDSYRVRCPREFFPCNSLANNGIDFRCMRDPFCTGHGGPKECNEG